MASGMFFCAMHPVEQSDDQLLAECDVKTLRRSGPGGQHRNKVETAVRLLHRPTSIAAEANERRSQAQNKTVALRRLKCALAICIRTERTADTIPSTLWKNRCHGGRVRINPQHDEFPILLAEAIDVISQAGWEPKSAAEQLGCTTSQLIRLLKLEPHAIAEVNRQREKLDLHRLK